MYGMATGEDGNRRGWVQIRMRLGHVRDGNRIGW